MLDLHNPEIKFTLQAVRDAALLVQTIQAELVSPALTKDDSSPVTVADFAAQALVAYRLMQAYPQDAMIGEGFLYGGNDLLFRFAVGNGDQIDRPFFVDLIDMPKMLSDDIRAPVCGRGCDPLCSI